MLLAIDTATRNASIALYDDTQVWAERIWFSDYNHTVELTPNIVDMFGQLHLAPADLRGVAVAIGPGSFTGMRIGLSVAKGLCLALGIPIKGVPTLDVVAQPFAGSDLPVCAVVHAGRGRFCAALYRSVDGQWTREGEFQLVTPDRLPALARGKTIFCGELDEEARQAIRQALGRHAVIATPAQSVRRAAVLAEMAWPALAAHQGDDLASLSPIYLHTAGDSLS
ncbi:MAG: tRNA (adenosine(37)-N6)-threonylcarbamoyltransferase complex dimerization subunit type 1 TsaB [Anaerolineae bacterium]